MHAAQREANRQPTRLLEETDSANYPSAPGNELLPIVSTEATKTVVGLGQFPEIADLVNIDSRGLGHISNSHKLEGYDVKGRNGKIISNYQMGMIAANQELIRSSLPERYLESGRSTQAVQQLGKPVSEPVSHSFPKVVLSSQPTLPAETDLNFMREFPEEFAYEVAYALNDWSNLVAKRERSIITLGARSERNVAAARQHYENLRRKSKAWTDEKIQELGLTESSQVEISKLEDLTEAQVVALSINKDSERLAQVTGKLSKQRLQFYDWWARQGGGDKFFSRQRLTGTAKKSAVMAAIGLPIGVVAGTVGVFFAGPIVGAVAAAGVSRGVARNLIRGHVDKSANSKTVSDAQYEKRLADQTTKIDTAHKTSQENPEQVAEALSVTDVYAEATAKSVRRNRLRLMGSVATGAAFGAIGGFLGDLVHDALFSNAKLPSASRPQVAVSPNSGLHPYPTKPHLPVKTPGPLKVKPPVVTQPRPVNHQIPPSANHHITRPTVPPPIKPVTPLPRPAIHGTTGQEFYVKPGGGEISEIQAYASSHNYSITPGSADRIYQELYAQHGSNIIKLDGNGPSTYLIAPGDIGLSHPGQAHWYPGIEDELRNLLAKDAA